MPRAIWRGSVTFALVDAPVRMYPAIAEHDLRFRFVHVDDGGEIGYRAYCKEDGATVPDGEVARAYEVKGELVLLADEDVRAAESASARTIEILDFVAWEQIDPIYFERTYYLGPEEGAERVYALLAEAMQRAGLAAIARFVLREREELGCLRVRDDVLTLDRMYYADEIRPADDVRPAGAVELDAQELEMAIALIERTTDDFNPGKYVDRYRERLLEILERKRRGGSVPPARSERPAAAPDLLAALQESLERSPRNGPRHGARRGPSRAGGTRAASERGAAGRKRPDH